MKRLSALGHLSTATTQHKQAWIDSNTLSLSLYTHIGNTHHLSKALHLFTNALLRSAAHKHTHRLYFSVRKTSCFVFSACFQCTGFVVCLSLEVVCSLVSSTNSQTNSFPNYRRIQRRGLTGSCHRSDPVHQTDSHSPSNSQDTEPRPGPRNKALSQITKTLCPQE